MCQFVTTCIFDEWIKLNSFFSDYYSDLRLLHSLDPFQQSFEWTSPGIRTRSSLASTGRDREELSPDFKDPDPSATEEKPILQPKPQQTTTEKPEQGKPQEGTTVTALPGGVIDVDANGFGSPFSADIDFGLGAKPFGFGDFLSGFNRNQWWKGWVLINAMFLLFRITFTFNRISYKQFRLHEGIQRC